MTLFAGCASGGNGAAASGVTPGNSASDVPDAGQRALGSGGAGSTSDAVDSSSSTGAVVDDDRCAENRAAGTITYVSPFGFHAGAGILDVFAAEKLGYFDALCLDVAFVTHATSSSALVSSNTAQVTNVGSAADVMNGIDNDANLVGVATYGDASNYAILTIPAITKLSQLDGKVLAYHGVFPVVLRRMLTAAGVDLDNVTRVLSPSYDPNQLFEGHYQALQAYRSNEPILLRAEGKTFHEFVPSDFGVNGTFNIQTFNRDFAQQHRGAVADFMRAEFHAFDYCAEHQSECVGILGDYAAEAGVTFNPDHARAVWKFESALAQDNALPGRGVGVQTTAEWQPEYEMMSTMADTALPPLSTFQDTDIVAGLYDGATLIWP